VGVSRSRLAQRECIARATIERWFVGWLSRLCGERVSLEWPLVLGIDEHFFSRRHGYATTFCDLKNHKIHDVVLGRSEAALESYLARVEGRSRVQVVCIDRAATYRALARKYFPQARIVADRFHVIRTVNHHFLACWKEIDPAGAKNRGLASLTRRHRHNLTLQQHERLSAYLREHRRWSRSIASSSASRICCSRKAALRNAAGSWRAASSPMWPRSVFAGSRHWSRSAILCMPGGRRSQPCGASPATTE
jgi:transposase